MKGGSTARVRCAIYTRVSTDQGLDQDFNSLDAQYEACSAYYQKPGPCWLDPEPVAVRRRWLFRRINRPP